ncbi:very short patch repair endonuclease [Lutimaribacter saemankumensis]|uniref:very short patch repair endonuclease n=1 Tax=Lutimaribacter saemankumensis TaxID=490829 RepID=UPI001FE059F5|nr:DNA mismatch endonuclease Vsr [Lutimaribacter saemankumensis]
MAAIKSKNTKPEMVIRRGLHARGFRFRLHDRSVPGAPDIVLRRHSALIDIRGCFFHGHDCELFRLPETRRNFWRDKIDANRDRDKRNLQAQRELGWRVAIVWECSLRAPGKVDTVELIDSLERWLLSKESFLELRSSS